MTQLNESRLVKAIRRIAGTPRGVRKGIGDDAAVLPWDRRHDLLLTVDAAVDGVDFRLKEVRPEEAGWKALAINLSDIAAMGGIPLYALVSLGLPAGLSHAWVRRFYAGMKRLAARFGVAVAGGDLSRSGVFFSSVTVAGKVEKNRLVLRSGARAGDWILVTGRLGGSILGKHLKFTPRLREARFLTGHFRIHAMMDLSDGLMKDLGLLMKESNQGACVFTEAVPVSKDALRLARQRKIEPLKPAPAAGRGRPGRGAAGALLKSALCDGEDFELLFTASPGEGRKMLALKKGLYGTPVSRIGTVTKKTGIVFQRNEKDPKQFRLPWKGYEHF